MNDDNKQEFTKIKHTVNLIEGLKDLVFKTNDSNDRVLIDSLSTWRVKELIEAGIIAELNNAIAPIVKKHEARLRKELKNIAI